MKVLFISILLLMMAPGYSQESSIEDQASTPEEATATLEEHVSTQEEEVTTQDDLMMFFVTEVVPAFGGFEHLLFSQQPSFRLQFSQGGMVLESCSFQLDLKQLRPIKYNLAEIDLVDVTADAEIGQSRFLSFRVDCGEQEESSLNLKLSLSIQDENRESSFYPLRVTSFGQEQVNIKLWSIELNTKIQNVSQNMIVDENGHVHPVLEDQDVSEESLVNILQIIDIEGVVHFSLPLSVAGEKEETPSKIPIQGTVFIPEEGSPIPVLDISMGASNE